MHVDGAVTWPVFTLPAAFLLSNTRPERRLRLDVYVLINNEIDAEFKVVPDRNIDIAGRAVSTMIKGQTRSVIFRTYQFAQENGLEFNLSYIDEKGPPTAAPGSIPNICAGSTNTATRRHDRATLGRET